MLLFQKLQSFCFCADTQAEEFCLPGIGTHKKTKTTK